MTRYLFLLFFISSVFLLSCSSDEDTDPQTSEYYFRFRLDGAEVDYKHKPATEQNLVGNMGSSTINDTEYFVMNVGGYNTIFESTKNILTFFIQDINEIQAGETFTNEPESGAAVPFSITLGYLSENGTSYTAGVVNTFVYGKTKIKIDTITEDYIAGTFSATLTNLANTSEAEKVIQNGEFKVPRFDQVK